MVPVLLTVLFAAAGGFALTAITATLRRYGGPALALRGQLAATNPTRGFAYKVTDHRTLRSSVNVVILPVRRASYRLRPTEGLRAAA